MQEKYRKSNAFVISALYLCVGSMYIISKRLLHIKIRFYGDHSPSVFHTKPLH